MEQAFEQSIDEVARQVGVDLERRIAELQAGWQKAVKAGDNEQEQLLRGQILELKGQISVVRGIEPLIR